MANLHSAQTSNHRLETYVFADSTARAAGTGYTLVAGDVGKIALQSDENSYWRLTDESPITWVRVGGFGMMGTFVQTYSTADKTLSAYTPDAESGAYTGIDNAQGGTPYAAVADVNALRVAVENLRALGEDLAAFVNSLVDELQRA